MSHVTTLDLKIVDLQSLIAAVHALGGELNQDGRHYTHYYGTKPCDAEITHPQAKFSVGLIKRGGAYELEADDYHSGRLADAFGAGLCRIKQQYGVAVAGRQMRRQGYRVRQTIATDGTIRLVCQK